MNNGASYPYSIATIVTHKAIVSMLEAASEGVGEGSYRDTHPWLVARQLLLAANEQQLQMPILFASKEADGSVQMSQWAWIHDIDVVELHRGQWESRCTFGLLQPMNAIWQSIDSIFIKPSQEQLDREKLEAIRVYRTALGEHHIHPYAICETPEFILDSLPTMPD